MATYFIDTHCHLHDTEFFHDEREAAYRYSLSQGVQKILCVATDERSSREAIEFADSHTGCFAAIGVHPHESQHGWGAIKELLQHKSEKTIAIGEIGLDYYYNHSPREIQITALEEQIQLALDHNLPISFHVREAFDDFWPILDNFHGIRGVLHSFTDTRSNMEAGLSRGLYIGVNGISTFTKDKEQQAMYAAIPLQKLLLETDAPFLTPTPFRGRMNLPAYVVEVGKYHAGIRNMSLADISLISIANAEDLFNL